MPRILTAMPDESHTNIFIDALLEWSRAWRPANHSVESHRGPSDVGNTSAYVQVVGAVTAGQVTVWETGESEMEVYDVSTLQPLWLEHFDFATADEFAVALGRFATALDEP
jgi:hypothetical protein